MAVEVRINYRGFGPNGTELFWTTIDYPEGVKEEAALRAAELGVSEYTAPRGDSPLNDWLWVFDPKEAKKRARAWKAQAKKQQAAANE